MSNCINLTCNPIDTVRIGLIGLGNRGLVTLRRYMVVPHSQITALSDLRGENLEQAIAILREHGRMEPATFYGEERWRKICESDRVDIVYICTDWASHAEMATYAMECGKHVALEVPAAMSVDECWQLVRTAEATQRHCVMLENCCYDTFHLGTMGIIGEGLLGDITHLEGAYIHDLRDRYAADERNGGYHKGWMNQASTAHAGNPYPTHGLGPICQILGIHRGDYLETLTSMTAPNKINNTLIKTHLGRTILLQYDVCTPRPYNRMQTVCGTRGFLQKYPTACMMLDGEEATMGEEATQRCEAYIANPLKAIIEEGKRIGVPNVMNYAMDRRLIEALHEGHALDMDVYDAAEWSCITELSQRSALAGGTPVEIPRFV